MNKEYYIDFDGVIVDSQNLIDDIFAYYDCPSSDPYWNYILTIIDWEALLNRCNEIENAFTILQEVEKRGIKAYILSRVFSGEEALDKQKYLRSKGITLPFIPVYKREKKSNVIRPNANKILIDDGIDNVTEWRENGGNAVLFPEEEQDLKFLIKKKVL